MSLSPDLPVSGRARSSRSRPSHCQGRPSIHTHWLTAPSPISKVTSFDLPRNPDDISLVSSDSGQIMTEHQRHQPGIGGYSVEDLPMHSQDMNSSLSHLHLSTLEHNSSWNSGPFLQVQPTGTIYDVPSNLPSQSALGGLCQNIIDPASPFSGSSAYDDSPLPSPYLSSPDLAYNGFGGRPPRSSPYDDYEFDEQEDGMGGKPYARLIFEALLQAPGHRMMLRDIYDWFERNTFKPRESGTNGWQNSIRHNLSMNHAFENDKTQSTNARGEPKKATSVWFLTENALRNGVQSTTRYRKNGGNRKTALNGRPDALRAKSGAKGGKAARRAARFRQMEQTPHMNWSSSVTPDDLRSFNQLVHAANVMDGYAPTGANSPPSPADQLPYTPPSLGHRDDLSMMHTKYDGGDNAFETFNSHDALFSQTFDGTLDDGWFQANQRG